MDIETRALERAASTGDPDARETFIAHLVRQTGKLDSQIRAELDGFQLVRVEKLEMQHTRRGHLFASIHVRAVDGQTESADAMCVRYVLDDPMGFGIRDVAVFLCCALSESLLWRPESGENNDRWMSAFYAVCNHAARSAGGGHHTLYLKAEAIEETPGLEIKRARVGYTRYLWRDAQGLKIVPRAT